MSGGIEVFVELVAVEATTVCRVGKFSGEFLAV